MGLLCDFEEDRMIDERTWVASLGYETSCNLGIQLCILHDSGYLALHEGSSRARCVSMVLVNDAHSRPL